jgi:hypothetical protein
MTMVTFLAAAASLLRLAIYYGYPSLVENAGGDVPRAIAAFAEYDVIVFGDGLELDASGRDPGLDAERRKLHEIVRGLRITPRRPLVFGYIDLGRSQALTQIEISRRVALWQRAGVDGIFFDEAGADFGVTPARRRTAVRSVHDRRLAVFMNAFNPDDLFAGDDSSPGAPRPADLIGPADMLLIESFGVRLGRREPPELSAARAAAALRWRERTGVRVLAVTTTVAGMPFDGAAFAAAYERAAALKLDGFGWGEPDFSAGSRLPSRFADSAR